MNLNACAVCCIKAEYRCQPCNVSFCKEHKDLHEQSKIREHLFERTLDQDQLNKIVENLILKIKTINEVTGRILLETKSLVKKIEELCKDSLQGLKEKAQFYMDLLQKCRKPIIEEDLKLINKQLSIPLRYSIPGLSYSEIQEFYTNLLKQSSELAPKLPISMIETELIQFYAKAKDVDLSLITLDKYPMYAHTSDRINTSIYQGTFPDMSLVAVKVFTTVDENFSLEDHEMINTEINILEKFSNIASYDNSFIKLYGVADNGKSIALYMEAHKRNLMELISDWKSQNFKPDKILIENWIYCLIDSFSLLHSHRICHRDIKPHNILVTQDLKLKIIDFGISRMVTYEPPTDCYSYVLVQGTRGYMAPELEANLATNSKVRSDNLYDADVFSLGMTILQIITFDDLTTLNLEKNNDVLLAKVADLSASSWIKEMLAGMLNAKPCRRMDIYQCRRIVDDIRVE